MLLSLKVIYEYLENINQSTLNKEETLKKYLKEPVFGKVLRQTLEYLANENLKFRINRINYCIIFEDKLAAEHQNTDSIFQMLDYLGTKDSDPSPEEISFLEKICSHDPETVEVVTRIINKQSGTGLTNKQIAKILNEKKEEE